RPSREGLPATRWRPGRDVGGGPSRRPRPHPGPLPGGEGTRVGRGRRRRGVWAGGAGRGGGGVAGAAARGAGGGGADRGLLVWLGTAKCPLGEAAEGTGFPRAARNGRGGRVGEGRADVLARAASGRQRARPVA